eukprot:TRINITY_DN22609_c0_g1_i1.p1 TRINITY_DN22609_c0_g1~~TRINITY_DN22609_c0_g1_i1.p1  ORF type:complete len:821 (+),score=99.82 TRINITY_DN22609_c0_g1_i1:82-2544(+)
MMGSTQDLAKMTCTMISKEWIERILMLLFEKAREQRRKKLRGNREKASEEAVNSPKRTSCQPEEVKSPKTIEDSCAQYQRFAAPWIPEAVHRKLEDAHRRSVRRRSGAGVSTADRGILVQQLLGLRDIIRMVLHGDATLVDTEAPEDCPTRGEPVLLETMNMHQVNNYIIKPITEPYHCSWVEFVSKERQVPHWMISHAWSTYFRFTVAMVLSHSQSRFSDQWAETSYWCCTLANNQHDLSELEETDILSTPFAKVLLSNHCLGTLLLCDPHVTPLRRIWCVFEVHLTARLQAGLAGKAWHLLDVATPVQTGSGKLGMADNETNMHSGDGEQRFGVTLLQDCGNGHFLERSDFLGIYFPLEVAKVGTEVDICLAGATHPEDRNAILSFVATGAAARQEQPPAAHPRYEELNRFVHCVFASAELYRLACERPADLAGIARLLELRANPTRYVRGGNTAIHAAVGADPLTSSGLSNAAELLELLLSAKSDPNVVNSQLCTALDYASKLPQEKRAVLCPVLEHYGAKPFEEVAPQLESNLNTLLESALASGFDSEGRAFGGRTVNETDARLMWPAKQALQVAATNLCLFPHASCRISVQAIYTNNMSSVEVAKSQRRAEKRAQVILKALEAAGCLNPFEVQTSSQSASLTLTVRLTRSNAAPSKSVATPERAEALGSSPSRVDLSGSCWESPGSSACGDPFHLRSKSEAGADSHSSCVISRGSAQHRRALSFTPQRSSLARPASAVDLLPSSIRIATRPRSMTDFRIAPRRSLLADSPSQMFSRSELASRGSVSPSSPSLHLETDRKLVQRGRLRTQSVGSRR